MIPGIVSRMATRSLCVARPSPLVPPTKAGTSAPHSSSVLRHYRRLVVASSRSETLGVTYGTVSHSAGLYQKAHSSRIYSAYLNNVYYNASSSDSGHVGMHHVHSHLFFGISEA